MQETTKNLAPYQKPEMASFTEEELETSVEAFGGGGGGGGMS